MRLLEDKVAIRPDKPDKASKGGILPDVGRHAPCRGTVIATGPGTMSVTLGKVLPMSVKAGDRVWYKHYVGDEVEIEGETLMIVDESVILLVI